jgi:hypothetical protein
MPVFLPHFHTISFLLVILSPIPILWFMPWIKDDPVVLKPAACHSGLAHMYICTGQPVNNGNLPVNNGNCRSTTEIAGQQRKLPVNNGNCISVARLENSSLIELLDFAKEILINIRLPEGSVLLFGSVSYLGRCGASLYAGEWTSLVAGASACWKGVHICPLIPVIVSPCSGSVTRETCEIAMWFSNIYEKSNHGLTETWTTLVESMETFSTGSTKLEAMDSYKIALPSSLNSAVLDTVTTFCTHDSRPVAFAGLPKDNC